MAILQRVSLLAAQSLIDGAARALGVEAAGAASNAVVDFLVARFTDHSLKLTAALASALAGESWWQRVKDTVARADDRALAEQIRHFLDAAPLAGLPSHGDEFREQCLTQLRAARKQGLLERGGVKLDTLARDAGAFVRFDSPAALLQAEGAVLDGLALQFDQAGFGALAHFLRLRPDHGSPLLAVAVRYALRREIESDAQLFQGLAFAKLEQLEATQERGFADLSDLLRDHGDRLEMLFGKMAEVMHETHADVKDIKAALATHGQQLQAVGQVVVRAMLQPAVAGPVAPQREVDVRLQMLNTLLTTPHRKLQEIWPVHEALIGKDPRFYVQLAAWYFHKGEVRDHKEMFLVALLLSQFPGHRDVGLALLVTLPPYQLVRVIDFIHGRKETVGEVVSEFGLFRNVPRTVKTEVARYLREREANPQWFDSTVLVARKALKRLYAVLHIRPGPRAQQILFDDRPPPDSRIAGLKALARCDSAEQQAQAIIENRIPFRIAISVLSEITPRVLEALIERMSPQELINNLQMLQRHGALAHADLKAMIDLKLDEAKQYLRTSTFKAEKAMESIELSGEMKQKLEDVTDAQVKAKGTIRRPTALFIDKSGSMESAIDVGRRIAAMISAVCAQELYVYAFDSMAYPIQAKGTDWAAWKQAFAGITANGHTSVGVAVDVLRKKKQRVEQIIVVTDEEEYEPPFFIDSLLKYQQALGVEPAVCFVKVKDSSTRLEDQCKRAGIKPATFEFTGDYYSLPNLIALLEPPSEMDLLLEILEYPLPERKVVVN